MSTPKYVERVVRLPEVFERLAAHPNGLALSDLAAHVGVPADELREDLMAFYSADVGPEWLMGLSRPLVLEFLGPDGDDDIDPNDAEVVRITDPRPFDELGVEYVDASELALIYTAARALHDLHPDDRDLEAAIDVLAETMFGDAQPGLPGARAWDHALAPLQEATRERRQVRIEYSRAWESGVTTRVIEPWKLVQTRRGWEVDAGPVDPRGEIRTFLLSNIRVAEVLDEFFEAPEDLDERLDRQRSTSVVRVRLPHAARWAADMYAEEVRVVADDETTVTVDLALLPPLDRRVGLLCLAAGPGAEVVEPGEFAGMGAALAAELLEHHTPGG